MFKQIYRHHKSWQIMMMFCGLQGFIGSKCTGTYQNTYTDKNYISKDIDCAIKQYDINKLQKTPKFPIHHGIPQKVFF